MTVKCTVCGSLTLPCNCYKRSHSMPSTFTPYTDNKGWACPLCGKANAPSTPQCFCKPELSYKHTVTFENAPASNSPVTPHGCVESTQNSLPTIDGKHLVSSGIYTVSYGEPTENPDESDGNQFMPRDLSGGIVPDQK